MIRKMCDWKFPLILVVNVNNYNVQIMNQLQVFEDSVYTLCIDDIYNEQIIYCILKTSSFSEKQIQLLLWKLLSFLSSRWQHCYNHLQNMYAHMACTFCRDQGRLRSDIGHQDLLNCRICVFQQYLKKKKQW